MIPYPLYFNEWEAPQEGIDTISIWVHPIIINRFEDFHEKGNIREAINLRWKDEKNKKTGQFYRRSYFIDIQSEALNPYADILGQIIYFLIGLVYSGAFKAFQNMDIPSLYYFFMEYFSRFFAINCIDFYFDIKKEDCFLLGKPNPYEETRYSNDYPSSLRVYSKVARLEYKNHISHKRIEQMEYQYRVEFHLVNGNCNYLDYRNIQGTFEIIFLRYLPQLARKWFDHRRNVVNIPNLYRLPYAHHLRQIYEMAHGTHIPQYRDLIKTPLRPKPDKKYGKDEVDLNWFTGFMAG